MKEYLHLFGTQAAHDAVYNDASKYYKPWVALTQANKNVTYNKGKRRVILTSATDEKPYDGTQLTNDTVIEGGEGFLPGEGATYDFSGTQTLVGSSPNEFVYTLNPGTSEDNYKITQVFGTLTVTDGTGPDEDPVFDDLVVTIALPEEQEEHQFSEGETATFNVDIWNIYDSVKPLYIVSAPDLTIVGTVPSTLIAGGHCSFTASHTMTHSDILNTEFEANIVVRVGNLEKQGFAVAYTVTVD